MGGAECLNDGIATRDVIGALRAQLAELQAWARTRLDLDQR